MLKREQVQEMDDYYRENVKVIVKMIKATVAQRDAVIGKLDIELKQMQTERDAATEVVENIQGKVAMYAGKFEMEKKAREKAEGLLIRSEATIKEGLSLVDALEARSEKAEAERDALNYLGQVQSGPVCPPDKDCPEGRVDCMACRLDWAASEAAKEKGE